jgi:CelD/BcsL family acetyltransferase involved in cellulose biosynthesis
VFAQTIPCPGLWSEIAVTSAPTPAVVHRLDPLSDSRWDSFLKENPRASLFHSTPWLQALHRTYGYIPVGYTTSAPGEKLENAIVFCRVESWLTGRRLVSLPFSDHCEPLVDRPGQFAALIAALEKNTKEGKWRYAELRSFNAVPHQCSLHVSTTGYMFHEIDLQPSLEELFSRFHKDSIQRKIRRAEREKLDYDEGQSDKLVAEFYDLLTTTRRRHYLPPQPRAWFENLRACFKDSFKIRIARKKKRALAAMITLRYKDTLVYKYGGSDSRYNNLGSMHLLYWKAIQDAKEMGLRAFDLGRTDSAQTGLIAFKNRWGARQLPLVYSRFASSECPRHMFEWSPLQGEATVLGKLIAVLPNCAAALMGKLLYKHVG